MKQIFLLLSILALCGVARPATASEQRPNIIIILVDDMGYGDPGCYNPQFKIATPNIDRLASEGMRFTDAHAPGPLCHPSRYGLITGQHPFRTDTSKWPKQPLIKKDQTTIASLLKIAGYRTAMVGKWHLGFEESGYDRVLPGGPVDRGFDRFFGFRASTDIPPYFYVRGDRAEAPPTNEIGDNNTEGWSPIQGAFWRGGGIAPDLQLKDVLPRLTSDQLVCFTDVMATLAEVTGTKLPDDAGPDSISFLPTLLGAKPENASMRNSLVIGKSIRSGPWKYIEGRESNLFMRQDSGTFPANDESPGQLYNLLDDVRETKNHANERVEIVIKLRAELARIQNATRTRP